LTRAISKTAVGNAASRLRFRLAGCIGISGSLSTPRMDSQHSCLFGRLVVRGPLRRSGKSLWS